MHNFGLIYQYEIKKIIGRKRTVIAFVMVLIATLLLNLSSIPQFSVGSDGANMKVTNKYGRQRTDWAALFSGIDIRWVDEEGEVIHEKVNPLKYIWLQRQFAMQWSGKPLNDETIQEMRDFLNEYDYRDENEELMGWTYQNYYWVFRSIIQLGMNPYSESISEQLIVDGIEQQRTFIHEAEQLSEEEMNFWGNHGRLSFPLPFAYTPAYRQLLRNAHWIHIMLIFFVIFALCESFSLERRRRTRGVVQATKKGADKAVLARILAGETVVVGAAFVLFVLSALIQFGLFGMDGWNVPIQQIGGFQWSRLMISAGNATLLMFGTSTLIAVLVGALTMLLSEFSQNAITAVSVQSAFLLFTLLFDYSIFHENRMLSQIWQYFPMQRISEELLYDERLVSVSGHLVAAIPFSTAIYLALVALFLLACAGHTIWNQRDRL
ncbi:MAG: hypothetical protein IJ567_10660 [Lachnospiraceae bacterium]|nr:hypothetical protein [Lachnospiraceae bacterium]